MTSPPGDHDALIATGFCRCGPRELVGGNVIPEVKRQSELTEITGTVGSVFLGMTIGCARCHDHKFDAIPTTDYYRLQAFFGASELTDVPIASDKEREAYAAAKNAIDKKVAPLKKQLAALEAPYRAAIKAKQADHAQPRGTRRREHPRQGSDARAEKAGQGPGSVDADHLGRGRRGGRGQPRRPRPARTVQARDLRDRTNAPASAGPCDGACRSEVESERHVRASSRRLQEPRAEGWPASAGRDPGLAVDRVVLRVDRRQGGQDRPPGGAGEMAGGSRQSPDRPGHCQSALAVPLRHGNRGDVERLWRAWRAAIASRAARLARHRNGGREVGGSSRSIA